MPEQLLGRIIRLCSNPGDVVLDPFTGSGTTLVTAKKLDRRYLGFETLADYAAQAQKRLDETTIGAPLSGAEKPLMTQHKKPRDPNAPRFRVRGMSQNHLRFLMNSSTRLITPKAHERKPPQVHHSGWDDPCRRNGGGHCMDEVACRGSSDDRQEFRSRHGISVGAHFVLAYDGGSMPGVPELFDRLGTHVRSSSSASPPALPARFHRLSRRDGSASGCRCQSGSSPSPCVTCSKDRSFRPFSCPMDYQVALLCLMGQNGFADSLLVDGAQALGRWRLCLRLD